MSSFYSWMSRHNESIAQDDGKMVYRKHPDGSPCHAKDPKDCPIISKSAKVDSADDLNDAGIDDVAYMEAVKNGDMETCAKMVREAAAKAMPDTKVVDSNGNPIVVYHSTNADWNVFDLTKSYGGGRYGSGIYLSTDKDFAKLHGTNTKSLFVNASEMLGTRQRTMTIQEKKRFAKLAERELGEDWGVSQKDMMDAMIDVDTLDNLFNVKPYVGELSDAIKLFNKSNGTSFSGIRDGDNGREICIYDNKLIKLSDPVTYDDDGNPIPLSKRFDFSNPDIRY